MGEHDSRSRSLDRPVELARTVVRHALATDVPFMAGAIAYQAFISLLPLLFLLVVLAATVGGTDVTSRLLTITVGRLPADARDLVRTAVRTAVSNRGNSIVGVAVLGFGSVAVFNGFDKAFTDLYGVERGATLPDQLRDAGVVLGALAVSLVAIAIAWQRVLLPARVPLSGVVGFVLLTVGLAVVLFPMYYVFPEVSLGWREVVPGVALAAVGWAALQALFQFYVRFVLQSEAFGVVSGVLLLATWLYFSGFVLLLGGALNAVVGGYTAEGASDERLISF
ncbi:YihY/virulence factor BrkB family protein [Halosimplex aquaticum]|uniref:YihY/virulence factor BrkB family protein n=1 Tax=Halosimplex aquaticum TaxID=3026162 RepID=A0ABD5XX45_9EURY|nr:YihY/virulence factor BrkB family protein [Halosimplex aquaticum]